MGVNYELLFSAFQLNSISPVPFYTNGEMELQSVWWDLRIKPMIQFPNNLTSLDRFKPYFELLLLFVLS